MKTHLSLILTVFLVLAGCQDKSSDIQNTATAATDSVAPTQAPAPLMSTTSLIRTVAQDNLPSEPGVGVLGDGKISSTGKSGYLIYGPYATLDAGTYQVTLDGTLESLPEDAHLVVDLVSNQGSNRLGSTEISEAPEANAVLAQFVATVPTNVTDLEVRVFVPENGRVSVSGYQVLPKQ